MDKELENSCPICMNIINDTTGIVKTNCGHFFCTTCFTKNIHLNNNINCALCRQNLIPEDKEPELRYIEMDEESEQNIISSAISFHVFNRSGFIFYEIHRIVSELLGPFPLTKEASENYERYINVIFNSNLLWNELNYISWTTMALTNNWYAEELERDI